MNCDRCGQENAGYKYDTVICVDCYNSLPCYNCGATDHTARDHDYNNYENANLERAEKKYGRTTK